MRAGEGLAAFVELDWRFVIAVFLSWRLALTFSTLDAAKTDLNQAEDFFPAAILRLLRTRNSQI